MRGPDVEQEGEIDPIVVIVAQGESPLIAAYRLVEGSRVFRLVPEPLVHRSPQAERLGVVGSRGVQLVEQIARLSERGDLFLRRVLLGLIRDERELLNDVRVFGRFRLSRCLGFFGFILFRRSLRRLLASSKLPAFFASSTSSINSL